MIKERYITADVYNDVREKMVFIGGPRQVGKTTLSLFIARNYFRAYQYFNWDSMRRCTGGRVRDKAEGGGERRSQAHGGRERQAIPVLYP